MHNRFLRFVIGLSTVLSILIAAFALLPGWIHNWGAAEEELTRTYPGDELIPQPELVWTHGIDIEAPVDEVWPWIAQIGDRRAAFYSYTFIENLIAGEKIYVNAGRILPEYQQPEIGGWLIEEMLLVEDYMPGSYLLGHYTIPDFFEWTWGWNLFESADGKTRLVMRMRIGTPGDDSGMGPASIAVDAGGFVMERRMMQGIKDRAEGRSDPPFSELIEIALWLAALFIGLAAALIYMTKNDHWVLALSAGIDSVLVLLVLTFLQPPLLVRAALDLALLGALWMALWIKIPLGERE